MNFATILGIAGAVILHVLLLTFGGILFTHDDSGNGAARDVELLSETEQEKPKDEQTPDEEKVVEELKEEPEEIPDAAEIVRTLEAAPVNSAPALAEASLAAIEQALNGVGGGGGDFAAVMDFNSGGVIGGSGKRGGISEEKLEEAFSLSEIDQGPRAVYQTAGNYPAELRGKKVEGVATVIFIVDSAGRVQSPRIEKSAHPAFEKPALEAVRQWKFEPGVKGGQRVACRMRVGVRFQSR